MNRQPMSKKTRFEVFKRDKFKCQYCGNSAPDVILEVDHIDPVSNGGTNEIINLITSCFDCNRGKGKRLLSDESVIQKQRSQLEQLEERRQQLELMMEWHKSLSVIEDDKVKMALEYWEEKTGYYASAYAKRTMGSIVSAFGLKATLEAIDIAVSQYVKHNIYESIDYAFDKIGGICKLSSAPEYVKKIGYVKGILRNRFEYFDDRKASIMLRNYVDQLRQNDYCENEIIRDLEHEVIPMSKDAPNWTYWVNTINHWIETEQ